MDGDRDVGRRVQGVVVQIMACQSVARPVGPSTRAGTPRDHREVDVDARRRLLVVFELGLGQRGAVGHAPVDRLELAEDVALVEQVGQDVEDAGLVPRVERQVGMVPVAQTPRRRNCWRWTSTHFIASAWQSARISAWLIAAAFEPRSLTTLCSIGRPWQSQPGT